jgi:SAM-dependent methyltransferase
MMTNFKFSDIRDSVREDYGQIARNGDQGPTTSCCCGPSSQSCCTSSLDLGYSPTDLTSVPLGADLGLGCGNPQAIAALGDGQTVLDLGSGAGFDAFLAAAQVGKAGHVIGVDMTAEMLSKARRHALEGEYTNVEFRLGEIENLPVADSCVDVIISNCVINLSPDKKRVFNEAFRVLRPGGRLAISDVVATADLPEEVRTDLCLYSSCVSGAATIVELELILRESGFRNISIKPKDDSREFIRHWVPGRGIEDYIVSAMIQADKPGCQ